MHPWLIALQTFGPEMVKELESWQARKERQRDVLAKAADAAEAEGKDGEAMQLRAGSELLSTRIAALIDRIRELRAAQPSR